MRSPLASGRATPAAVTRRAHAHDVRPHPGVVGRWQTADVSDREVALVHSSTATGRTPRQVARATLGFTLRSRRFLVQTAVVVLVGVTILAIVVGDDLLPGVDGASWAIVCAAVFTLLYLALISAIVYVTTYRNVRRALPVGSVQRTGFGPEGFALESHLGTSRHSYRAVQSADTYGGFVFVRFVGQPLHHVLPDELWPAEAMSRLREANARDRSQQPD